MSKIVHHLGMPIGFIRDGRICPFFICAITGKPITPENSGTLYYKPDTGEMIVLSIEGEDIGGEPDSSWYSIEIDLLSFQLFQNSAGPDGSTSQKHTREKHKHMTGLS